MKFNVAALVVLVAAATALDAAAAWDQPLYDALKRTKKSDGPADFGYHCNEKTKHGETVKKVCHGSGFGGYKGIKYTYQAKLNKKDPSGPAKETFKVSKGSGTSGDYEDHYGSKIKTSKKGSFKGQIIDKETYKGKTNKLKFTCNKDGSCKWN